jgi:hypothetical protein
MPSDFTAPRADGAFYFFTNSDGVSRRCAISGAAFVYGLQVLLRDNIRQPLRTFDNTTIVGSAVTPDRRWGVNTTRALWALGRANGMPAPLLDAVRATATAQRVTRATLEAAVWLVYRAELGAEMPARIRAIVVPADVVPPVWGVAPPIPPGATGREGLACADVPAIPPDGVGAPTPAVPADPAQAAAAARAEAQLMLSDGGTRPGGLEVGCNEWRLWTPAERAARVAAHNAWSAPQQGRLTWPAATRHAAADALCGAPSADPVTPPGPPGQRDDTDVPLPGPPVRTAPPPPSAVTPGFVLVTLALGAAALVAAAHARGKARQRLGAAA